MSEHTAEIDALKDLLQSQGWKLYREAVMKEITSDFDEHITKALDSTDSALAIDRMRQVAAVRKAGLRWLKLPQERLNQLQAQVQGEVAQAAQEHAFMYRRGGL